MSDTSQGPGWWQASDGRWYPPESQPAPGPVTKGPVGRPRSVGITILLAFVTFGIWTIVWSAMNGEELKNYNRTGAGGAVHAILTLFISPVVMFLMADEVDKMYRSENQVSPISAIWGLWFLLPLIGNIIWYVRIQNAINDFWMARGAGPPTGP